MRILGIDYGDARVGIAVSDLLGITAQGIDVIAEKNFENQVEKVASYVKEYKAEKIVLGFPKNMNGTVGERGEKTKVFADALKKQVDAEIIFWDERLTTAAAHRTLAEGSVSGKKRKGILDKLSAVFILQGYLDSQR
ncbi:MAG: Holliday junction resolvase RuvX [Clostridia bacterium]|nr:Holliday junction resolvase RuvX [Clostridia bacterium]